MNKRNTFWNSPLGKIEIKKIYSSTVNKTNLMKKSGMFLRTSGKADHKNHKPLTVPENEQQVNKTTESKETEPKATTESKETEPKATTDVVAPKDD